MNTTSQRRAMGERRFGRINWLGLYTLIDREIRRFLTVWTQTVMAPVVTSLLFMAVFTLAFGDRRGPVGGIPFEQFLAPGILMMVVIQNSFANTSSSLMVAKVQGNIVDTLMPPLSPMEILIGYIAGGLARGILCAIAVGAVVFTWAGIWPDNIAWLVWFVAAGSVLLSLIGLLAAIQAEKFDQMSMITNFVITPLSFLSGTFYSIRILPEPFHTASLANPFFYLIDGARHGALGTSDASPWLGLAVTLALIAILAWWAWRWLASGHKLKA